MNDVIKKDKMTWSERQTGANSKPELSPLQKRLTKGKKKRLQNEEFSA